MEGAVLLGINPNIINTRIAKYTIGMKTRNKWNEKKYSKNGIKFFDESSKKWVCDKCFHKFI